MAADRRERITLLRREGTGPPRHFSVDPSGTVDEDGTDGRG